MKHCDLTIVIVRDRASSGGGIFNYYQFVTRHLEAKVHFVGVGKPYSFYDGKEPWFLRFNSVRLLWDWLTLAAKIVWFRPDLVHINPSFDPPFLRSVRRDAVNVLIGRLFRKPVLVFWRGWENTYCGQPEFPGGNESLFCRLYKMASAQIVLSERFKDDLVRWGFNSPIHVETTIASDECLAGSPEPPQPDKVRTNLLYLSRVEAGKGVFELLDAYKILKARNPAYTLTVAGDGPDLVVLKDYAKKLELKDAEFTGFVKGKEKVECYRRGGVFCFLSTYAEGMPNAVLEALALGLPVVSSDVGGLRDILRDGENGFVLFPSKEAPEGRKFDPLAVANAIEKTVQDPELYQRIAVRNWHYARERFAAPVVATRLEAIYRGMFSPKQPAQDRETNRRRIVG